MARRGAPFGNRNAVKHGLFVRDPDSIPPDSLQNANHLEIEIAVLRVYILRLLALTSKSSDVKLIMSALHGFTLAAARLNSLIKTRHYLNLNQGRIPPEYLTHLRNSGKMVRTSFRFKFKSISPLPPGEECDRRLQDEGARIFPHHLIFFLVFLCALRDDAVQSLLILTQKSLCPLWLRGSISLDLNLKNLCVLRGFVVESFH